MKKIFKVLVLIFIALFCYKTNAQDVNWNRIENLNVINFNSIAINSNDDIFVATFYSLFRSTNNGNEWIKLNKPGVDYSRNMVINQKGDIYWYSYSGEIYLSEDNGESWTNILKQGSDIYGIVIDSASRIFVANCYGGVLCSTDNGGSWKQVLDSADVHGIVILPSQVVIAGCCPRGKPKAFRSDDHGENWQECFHGFTSLCQNSTETLFAVAGFNGMYGLYGGQYIYRSTDKGETWDSVYECFNRGYEGEVLDLVIDNHDQIFAVTYGEGIVTSTDNGNSWFTLNTGLRSYNVSCIEKNSKDEIFIGTQDGVFKCVKKTITQVFNDKQILPKEFILSQNYPNPFNPSTKIKYSVPQLSNVVIKVFDVLGNEIETLLNEEKPSGIYEVEFHAQQTTNNKQLSSGIYFYQMKAGDFITTKKMILMK